MLLLGHLPLLPPPVHFLLIWVQPGAPCSSMQAFCYLHFISYLLGRAILQFGGGDPWRATSSPGPPFSLGPYCTGFFQGDLWRGLFSWNPGLLVLLFALLPPLTVLNSTISCSLQPKLTPPYKWGRTGWGCGSTRSSRAPFLVSLSIAYVRKLSSIHSRNLLDCLCPAVLFF